MILSLGTYVTCDLGLCRICRRHTRTTCVWNC